MSDTVLLAAIAAASTVLGGGGGAVVAVKWMNRNVDDATADATRTSAASTAKKDDLEVLRGVIAELRDSEIRKNERIDALEKRMAKVEERERHALTRAAVHEAWDQMAFAMLLRSDPNHPPPPPLTPPRLSAKGDLDDQKHDDEEGTP